MRALVCKKKLTTDEFDFKLAKICYFYGWTPQIVEELSAEEVEKFWHLITRLEAQKMLENFTLADWPNMKKDKRASLHRKLHDMAYPELRKTISLEDFMKQSAGGIGG